MIDDITIQRIKDAARIVDVVADYVTLRRAGTEYTGLCPFHEDRHAGSFMVNPAKNIATCFPCGRTWDPVGFVMEAEGVGYTDALRLLARKYGIPVDETANRPPLRTRPEPRPAPPPLPRRTWPLEYAARNPATADNDTFVRWLHTLPWDGAQRARLPGVLAAYAIGHSHLRDDRGGWHDFTVFWQIGENLILHNGHFMKYCPDGHRVKDSREYPTTWLHARMKRAARDPFDPEREQASHCLFGQHLMRANPEATVNVVESEKTAVIMSVAYGCSRRQIWMACCGLGNLTGGNDLLRPLVEAGRRIVLYPDRDGVERWRAAALKIGYGRLTVNAVPVLEWWRPEDGDKADIADIVLRGIRKREPLEARAAQVGDLLEGMCRENPSIRKLIDKLNLIRK